MDGVELLPDTTGDESGVGWGEPVDPGRPAPASDADDGTGAADAATRRLLDERPPHHVAP